MQLYNVTWQFPEIEGQKAAAKLIEYMANGAEGDHIDGFRLISVHTAHKPGVAW